jgi:hypothetical protein
MKTYVLAILLALAIGAAWSAPGSNAAQPSLDEIVFYVH